MQILVSPEDSHLLSLPWYIDGSGYVRRNWSERGVRCYALLHRVIARASPGVVVDHINGNPSDNRRENLRICSHAENVRNRKRHANNVTGAKGVYPYKGRFRAQIRIDGKKILVGAFDSVDQAAAAYAAAAVQHHGAFARVA